MNIRRILIGVMASASLSGLVACGDGSAPTFTVAGTLAGSVGTVVLKLNGTGDIAMANPGAFAFTAGLVDGATYAVTADGAQKCNVANGTGTIGAANVTNVAITCTSVIRSAVLSGAQENPANPSAATGEGAVVVNPATREITGGVTFSGLTPTSGGHHIHQAPAGNPTLNGPVVIALILSPDGQSAFVPPGSTLTDAQYAALLAGELYLNVHTAAFPGGEIRGPLVGRGSVTAGLATLNGAQEVPPNGSSATGRGTIVLDSSTRKVIVAYATHNVGGSTVAHIHTGAPGVSGPPDVVTLSAGAIGFAAPSGTTLSTQNLTNLDAGNTYFNIHSTANPGGEIRGQIVAQ